MPNPKLGTVTFEVGKAVKDQKLGKVEFRTEKTGIVHAAIGRKSFDASKLADNFNAFLATIVRMKPQTSKGTYIQKITLAASMGPGVPMDPSVAMKAE